MKKVVWTPEQYREERSRYLEEVAKSDPRPSSMISHMGWAKRHGEVFDTKLAEEGVVWETNVTHEYARLRDTRSVQAFLASDREEITEGEFILLSERAIEEAFGDLSHLGNGYPKLLAGAIKNKRDVLRRILTDREIPIVLQRERIPNDRE